MTVFTSQLANFLKIYQLAFMSQYQLALTHHCWTIVSNPIDTGL